jgi:hypothetical protein
LRVTYSQAQSDGESRFEGTGPVTKTTSLWMAAKQTVEELVDKRYSLLRPEFGSSAPPKRYTSRLRDPRALAVRLEEELLGRTRY